MRETLKPRVRHARDSDNNNKKSCVCYLLFTPGNSTETCSFGRGQLSNLVEDTIVA